MSFVVWLQISCLTNDNFNCVLTKPNVAYFSCMILNTNGCFLIKCSCVIPTYLWIDHLYNSGYYDDVENVQLYIFLRWCSSGTWSSLAWVGRTPCLPGSPWGWQSSPSEGSLHLDSSTQGLNTQWIDNPHLIGLMLDWSWYDFSSHIYHTIS